MSNSTILYIVIAIIVAGIIAIFQYINALRNREKVSYLLAFLRFMSVLLIGILLINPKIERTELEIEKPGLVVLVDNSESIANFESEDSVQNFVSELNLNSELNNKYDLNFFKFGSELKLLDSLTFSERNSDISKPLRSLNSLYEGKDFPVILISDGNQTKGTSYEYVSINKPIYPIIVGDTTAYEDIRISQLNVNKYTYLKNKFPVEVYLNYIGNENRTGQFSVFEGARRVYTERIQFSANNPSVKKNFYLSSANTGAHYYTAQIIPLNFDNEKNSENNSKNFVVEVIDEQSKTLIFSSFLHPDLGSFKESIEQNEQRKVDVKVGDDSFNLDDYQSVIIYQPTELMKELLEQLDRKQMNYAIITGSKTDWAFLNSVQSNFNKNAIQQTENYRPVFNPSFTSFSIPELDFDSFPPLLDKFGPLEFSSNLEALLWQKIGDFVTDTPLIATFEDNDSRRVIWFGENSWKWRMSAFEQSNSFVAYDNFIGMLIQFLSATGSKKRLSVDYESLYYLNETNQIMAQYLDKNYQFDPNANLWIEFRNTLTNETNKLPLSLVGNSYTASLSSVDVGEYSFTLTIEDQNETFSGNIKIIDFNVETQFSNADVTGLKQLSQKSEGSFYYLNNGTEIIEELMGNERFKSIQKQIKKTNYLIEWQWLLGLIILSLSIEWFIRKYNGLI